MTIQLMRNSLAGLMLGLLMVSTVYALPAIPGNDYIHFEDWTAERLLEVPGVGTAGKIEVGEKLVGVMSLDKIEGALAGEFWSSNAVSNESILGSYQFTVKTISAPDVLGKYTITFDPTSSFMNFYSHSSFIDLGLYAENNPIAATIGLVESGTLYLSGKVNYWTGYGPIAMSDFLTGASASFKGGFDYVVNNTGATWMTMQPGELIGPWGFPLFGDPQSATQFYTESDSIYGATGKLFAQGWQLTSRDVHTYGHTPEPGSMLLLGMGLAGLAALRRKKAA